MLGQLQVAEPRARAAGGASRPGAGPTKSPRFTALIGLLKDSVRVVVLSLALTASGERRRRLN